MRKLYFLAIIFLPNLIAAQISENVYKLSDTDGISQPVKNILIKNLKDKQFVFLGESFHKSGADLKKKADFVRYLVEEKGFKDIIFESDFYALFNNHSKDNLYAIWAQAEQCQELFKFLNSNGVTIWGVDNKFHTSYSKKEFPRDLRKFLEEEKIAFTKRYISIVDNILKFEFDLNDLMATEDLQYFDDETQRIFSDFELLEHPFWYQAIQNLKSCSLTYRAKNIKHSIAERDKQMADNLDFFANSYPEKKFIVWAANAHIAKTDSEYMGKTTMGVEFLKKNRNRSYHIAFGSIKMPYRKVNRIQRKRKSKKNLLHYLPNIDNDYFMDNIEIRNEYPEIANSPFYAKLWSGRKSHLKTKWLQHFDAIVFIEDGELSKYINSHKE
jgi:erythromycin esterase